MVSPDVARLNSAFHALSMWKITDFALNAKTLNKFYLNTGLTSNKKTWPNNQSGLIYKK
jgi:hypothetical protein